MPLRRHLIVLALLLAALPAWALELARERGFSVDEIRRMTVTNPAALVQ